MTDRIDLSAEERAALTKLMDNAHYTNVPAYALDDPQSSRRVKVFYVALDGTNNDRERDHSADPTKDQETLVARFERELHANKPANVETLYVEGVGTRAIWPVDRIQQALGIGCEERAERAYNQLVAQVKEWQEKDPNIVVHVHTTGFSRGAASGLHLMNLIEERGLPGKDGEKVPFRQTAALFDTVATGQENNLKLGIPPSAQQVFHLTADDEHRRLFSLTSAVDPGRKHSNITVASDTLVLPAFSGGEGTESSRTSAMFNRVVEKAMPGAHSDVGGSYPDGKLKEVSAYLMSQYHQQLGLPINHARPAEETLAQAYKHDSRWSLDVALDTLVGKFADRQVLEQGPVGWSGSATIMPIDKDIPASGNLSPLDSRIQLPKDTPSEVFKEPVTLRVSLDQGNVKLESNRPGLFSYDAQNDRLLVAGQPAGVFGVSGDLKHHLGAGDMRYEFAVQRSNLYYQGKDNEHVTEAVRAPEKPDILRDMLSVMPPNTILKKEQDITALMLAARAGYADIVRDMMDNGGNPYFQNKEGKSALDLARTPELQQVMRDQAQMSPEPVTAKTLERADFERQAAQAVATYHATASFRER